MTIRVTVTIFMAAILSACTGGEPPAEMAHERIRQPSYSKDHVERVRQDVEAMIFGMDISRLRMLAGVDWRLRCDREDCD